MTDYRMRFLQRLFRLFLILLFTLGPEISRAGDWQLLPFVKADAANPRLAPRAESEFDSPFGGRVKWGEGHVFHPRAVVRDGKVWLLCRAQDKAGVSRLGLAWSDDGLHFTRRPQP